MAFVSIIGELTISEFWCRRINILNWNVLLHCIQFVQFVKNVVQSGFKIEARFIKNFSGLISKFPFILWVNLVVHLHGIRVERKISWPKLEYMRGKERKMPIGAFYCFIAESSCSSRLRERNLY